MPCMVERLPKNCARLLDNFEKTFGDKARLGVKVLCTKGGKNRFYLKVDLGTTGKGMLAALRIYKVKCAYDDITVPAIGDMFSKIYPDFLMKPTQFMPLTKLVNEFKLDKEALARNVMQRVKSTMTANLKHFACIDGVSIYAADGNEQKPISKFKSFNEFMIWVDLNVK